jgi:beta-lactamase class A
MPHYVRLRTVVLGMAGAVALGATLLYSITGYFEEKCQNKFNFVNNEVVCTERNYPISKEQYINLRHDLEAFIAQRRAVGVENVSVYFRDLHHGPVMGINELADFAPASLLKLPIAMMYLSKEDSDNGFLARQPVLRYSSSMPGSAVERREHPSVLNLNQHFAPLEEIIEGSTYSIEDLLFRMLAYSDNRAAALLVEHANAVFGVEDFIHTFHELGIIELEDRGDEFVTVRSYSSLFRLLYNSSYLSYDLSEKVLAWLSQASFKVGLVAGVPEGILIAHKFGERGTNNGQVLQLHDCGIVYYPGNPYLLCVMSKGDDMKELAGVIQTVSRMVYESVDARRRQ